MQLTVTAQSAPQPTARTASVSVTAGEALVVKGLRAQDVITLSRRYATDANKDGRIDDAEARAFAKAAKLPVAPNWLDKMLQAVGLQKPTPLPAVARLAIGQSASPALLAARAAQEHLGSAGLNLDWAQARVESAGANAHRVTVGGIKGQPAQTLVVRRTAGTTQFTVSSQRDAAVAKAEAQLSGAFEREAAKAIADKLITVAPTGWAPELNWGTMQATAGPVDSDMVSVKAENGKTYRFYVAMGQGENDTPFVGPAQLQELYFSGIDATDKLGVGSAILEALAPQMPDGWPPELDWKTLTVEHEGGRAVRAGVQEPKGGASYRFAVTQTGEGDAATYAVKRIQQP